jgi:hypothetical protein
MDKSSRKNLKTQSIILGFEILSSDSKKTIQESNIIF